MMAEKVLVTGATGFIGNYVVRALIARGEDVVATSCDSSKARTFSWYDRVEYRDVDISAYDSGLNYYDYFGRPDNVIHLAWSGLSDYKALTHFEENLSCHYLFLKNLISNGCRKLTVAGTCLEYGLHEGKLDEDMDTNPTTAYGLAKDSLRRFLFQLRSKYDFSLIWTRLFYLYGEGQNFRSLFSQLDRAIEEGLDTFNMSGGEQLRDYLPVAVAAENIVRCSFQQRVTGIVNCCSGRPVSIRSLIEAYIAERGVSIKLNFGYYPYPDYEPMRFWGDNRKLQSILNEN